MDTALVDSDRVPKPTIDPDVLSPHNLPYRMRLLVQAQGRGFQQVLDPFHLTPLHWGILSCLWQEDGLATQVIAGKLEQLGGTVTVGLDAMQKRGLIDRRPDPEDRRISRVWLNRRGAELQAEVVPQVREYVDRMFACFSPDEVQRFSELVDRLRDHMAEEESTGRT